MTGVRVRHLALAEVLKRQRASHAEAVSRHNAGVLERMDLGPTPSRRDQVLEEFPALTRRWARQR